MSETQSHKVSQYGQHRVCLQFVTICLFRYAESNQYVRVICAIASLQTCENYTCFPASKRPKQGKPMVPNSSDEQQLLGFTPRYAEHFVGAAALIGAFALVFGAMALGQNVQSTYCLQYMLEQACSVIKCAGAWLLFRTTLIQFKFVREIVGQG